MSAKTFQAKRGFGNSPEDLLIEQRADRETRNAYQNRVQGLPVCVHSALFAPGRLLPAMLPSGVLPFPPPPSMQQLAFRLVVGKVGSRGFAQPCFLVICDTVARVEIARVSSGVYYYY